MEDLKIKEVSSKEDRKVELVCSNQEMEAESSNPEIVEESSNPEIETKSSNQEMEESPNQEMEAESSNQKMEESSNQEIKTESPNCEINAESSNQEMEVESSNQEIKTESPNQEIVEESPNFEKKFENVKSIDVLHFDRTVRKKCRFPNCRENLVEILKESSKGKEFESVEKSLEGFPKNFCKKDLKTGIQKQFECLACKCLIESLLGLMAHIKGEKHAKAILDFKPR